MQKDGAFQALVGLLTVIAGGSVALGAGVQQTGRVNYSYFLLYLVAGLIPVVGMLHFVHNAATTHFMKTMRLVYEGEITELRHAHDGRTVSLARYLSSTSLAFMLLCAGLVWAEAFPGQCGPTVCYTRH